MKDLERSARVLGQVLKVRAWEVEQQRAQFREASLAFARCERRQRDIETEIRAIGDHVRARLAPGRLLDVASLQHSRVHGEEWQRSLHAAAEETARAGARHEEAREALSAVFAEREALDTRRQDLLAEMGELRLRQNHREQDESYAARIESYRPAHDQD